MSREKHRETTAEERARRAEERRLKRILDNEDYGPKLVRLSERSQRAVLDLISSGDTRAAKAKIIALTDEQLQRRREQSMHRAAGLSTRRPTGSVWRQPAEVLAPIAAERRPDKQFDPDVYESTALLRAQSGDLDRFLALRGSEAAMIEAARWDAKQNLPWSPFWYHYWR